MWLARVLLVLAVVYTASAVPRTRSSRFRHHGQQFKRLGINPGPSVTATKGQVWPKPQQHVTLPGYLIVRPRVFVFTVSNHTCDIMQAALERYAQVIRRLERTRRTMKMILREEGRRGADRFDDSDGELDTLYINLLAPCEEFPHQDMDEHYELRVNSNDMPGRGLLTSQSIWGILRGLETFSQLLYITDNPSTLIINSTSIMDFPRFPYRGLHLDTARHFMPVRIILQTLQAMEINKLNVFHWHIVDDQSFPYESLVYPDLAEKGAYAPTHVYKQEDIFQVVQEARFRGIRVIPEFDTPGHTRSWGQGYPELLTECYQNGKPDGSLGPVNPILNSSYDFMQNLFTEVKKVFPDDFIHLGGDEVPFDCWESNPDIQAYLTEHKQTTEELEEEYIQKVIDIVSNISGKSIVWQEVFDNGVNIQDGVVVHVWKTSDYMEEMAEVTKAGYTALLSSCWYLDHISSGGDWQKFYSCDPYFFAGTDEQRRRVLGGEACMWSEVVDSSNVMTRIWPRASATAEKLWSAASVDNLSDAAKRLEEHVCRMNRRGIPTQPANGPGFCPDQNFV